MQVPRRQPMRPSRCGGLSPQSRRVRMRRGGGPSFPEVPGVVPIAGRDSLPTAGYITRTGAAMSMRTDRRRFLQTSAAGGALVGLGDLGFLSRLRPVSADEAKLDPKVVRLQPEIEPLVRLLEETPRERLLEEVAGRIHKGLSYQEVLAALLLAGVRNVQPRPSVGHKFHAVLVVNSAHLASLGSPDSDRWLPIFWALDHFKSSQAQDVREGNWTMGPVDESAVPPAGRRARRSSRPWTAGTSRPPTRRSPGWPARPGPTRSTSSSSATAPATSATSATRRSTWPTVGGRSSASAGSTPSRSSARWPTPCSSTRRATRPTATSRPTDPGGSTWAGRHGSGKDGTPASPTPLPLPTCSRPCARARTTTPASRSSSS